MVTEPSDLSRSMAASMVTEVGEERGAAPSLRRRREQGAESQSASQSAAAVTAATLAGANLHFESRAC